MNAPAPRLAPPGLSVQGVSVTYRNGLTALDDASFDLPEGSITALVGVNGSGKSTLFKAIMGFVPVSTGGVGILALSGARKPLRVAEGLYQCGDHTRFASIDGAMESGSRVAEEIFAALHA